MESSTREYCISCKEIQKFIAINENREVTVKCSSCGFCSYKGLMYDVDVAKNFVENY